MSLKDCVTQAGLADVLMPGLKALGSYSVRVEPSSPIKVLHSVDLDAALTKARVPGPKWDYGIGLLRGQQAEVAWVEVHHATSGEVLAVLGKLEALKIWIHERGGPCRAAVHRFHWVASGGVHIDSARRRRLAAAGLRMPVSHLRI